MARAFARIAFTPDVHEFQQRMGSRTAYRAAELGEPEQVQLGDFERAFIAARDSFYLATVGQDGWPYVQHRGGPPGFLRVLDHQTLGFADYAGNRQYISAGNLSGEERVSLFLMDYAGQRRLKIWGRARLVDAEQQPSVLERLDSPHYRARVERGMLITVEAFDWNCPKHITPRYTEAEVRRLLEEREEPPAPAVASNDGGTSSGTGPLRLVVSALRQLTPRIRAYELRDAAGGDLPPVLPGAHLSLPVRLSDGSVSLRQFSISSDPAQRQRYEIAVLKEDRGRGGSLAIHTHWSLGTRLDADLPANQFPLGEEPAWHCLIAGGIGITPLKSMAHALKAAGRPFSLHYTGRTPAEMAYLDEIGREFPEETRLHTSRGPRAQPLDVRALMRDAPAGTVFHVCGPSRLIRAAQDAVAALGLSAAQLQTESFE